MVAVRVKPATDEKLKAGGMTDTGASSPALQSRREILITGCSSGIGAHCAGRLVEDGWRVFATARTDEALARLERSGATALYLDYADHASTGEAVRQVLEATDGRLFALYHNGGYGQYGAVEDLSTDALRRQFEAGFFGVHELTRQIVPVMRAQGAGRIVYCSSVLGFIPLKLRGGYGACKYAIEGLAATQRLELAGTGIHVSIIEPGPISTDFGGSTLRYLQAEVDVENSAHRAQYQRIIARLEGGTGKRRPGPEVVYRKLAHALNSNRPRAYYPVTTSAWLLAAARRLAPWSVLDRLLIRAG